MEIKILFDNKKEDIRYIVGWGVSYLIDNRVLFDAGENGEMLSHNIDLMGVDRKSIKKIVISHEHWDHIGGLWHLLTGNPGIPVYVCPDVGREFKDKISSFGSEVVEVQPFMEIDRDIFTTGETMALCRYGMIPEQALILRSKNGISVISGCAHNGITEIIAAARDKFNSPVDFVLGGFHTLELSASAVRSLIEKFQYMGVKIVSPTHCTGEEAIRIFRETYGPDFIEAIVGRTYHI